MLDIDYLISQATAQSLTAEQAVELIGLIDLTDLDEAATEMEIAQLAAQTITQYEQVAAVCVHPQSLNLVRMALPETGIRVATVLNFPAGQERLSSVLQSIEAVREYADEIDVVFPYQQYLAGQMTESLQFIEAVRARSKDLTLKVIMETGAFTDRRQLFELAQQLIERQVDFLKTSTGRHQFGANLEAVAILLQAIQRDGSMQVGIKISGGVRDLDQAAAYLAMVRLVMGEDWIARSHCRIGSSQLLTKVLAFLSATTKVK